MQDIIAFEKNYCLESKNDNTDRTAEIQQKLALYGVCVLGAGLYCVRGVRMPKGSALIGMGNSTQLLLDSALEAGFAVQMDSFCTVRDLCLIGAQEELPFPTQVGERHGIVFYGTATTKDWMGQPCHATVDRCVIRSFSGGGITGCDTGYYIRSAMTASNCHIFNCGAGINLSHFSEYHEFTNMMCCENGYGCINNGGNNVFVNCGFNGNTVGFMMDNRQGKSPNNSHGSAVGCTINHTDGNKGIGVLAYGAAHGYMFTGCQMFFSKIVLEDCCGIVFDASNFGRGVEIAVRGGGITLFSNNIFHSPPPISISENNAVRMVHCYARDGAEIVPKE